MRHHRHVPRCHQPAGARRCQRRWVARDHRVRRLPSSRRTLEGTGGGSAPKASRWPSTDLEARETPKFLCPVSAVPPLFGEWGRPPRCRALTDSSQPSAGTEPATTQRRSTIPTPTTTITQPPATLPQSSAASGPAGSPLGRYLLHPGQQTAAFFHHVLHVVAVSGHVAVPIAGGVVALLIAWKVLQAVGRLRAPTNGHLVEVELPPVVDPKRSAVFWRNVHAVLAGRCRLFSPPPHVAFEIEGSPSGVRLRFWVAYE